MFCLEVVAHIYNVMLVVSQLFQHVQSSQLVHSKRSEVSDQENEKEHDNRHKELIGNAEFVNRVEIVIDGKHSHAYGQADHHFEEGTLEETQCDVPCFQWLKVLCQFHTSKAAGKSFEISDSKDDQNQEAAEPNKDLDRAHAFQEVDRFVVELFKLI